MYKVTSRFIDLQDDNHAYKAGDIYPREGAETSDKRIAELSGKDNLQGRSLIKKVEEETKEEPEVLPESQEN